MRIFTFYSAFFFSYIGRVKCYDFKGQCLENRQSSIFQALSNIVSQRCRVTMTKHRQQSPILELKE